MNIPILTPEDIRKILNEELDRRFGSVTAAQQQTIIMSAREEDDELIDTKEACRILGCCAKTMQTYRNRKLFRAIIRSFSVSTTRNADSIPLVRPEPIAATHVVSSATPADAAEESPCIIRRRRCRAILSLCERSIASESEGVVIPAREIKTSSADSTDTSPLAGKESGNWEMPRVVVSAIILLRGEGLSVGQISKTTGLGARSISRFLCDCATSQKES